MLDLFRFAERQRYAKWLSFNLLNLSQTMLESFKLLLQLFLFQAAMGTVHGPKLAALVGEVLQPLDLGKEKNTCNASG